ncbi:MAG: hypothetical protein JXA78_18900 [Anaerolineales bacterium]|nr:hypothetical protein [Anaerolineales bacterium]
MHAESRKTNRRWIGRWIGFSLLVIILLFMVGILGVSIFGYALHSVGDNEIAVRLQKSVIKDIVGPGVYTDLNPFADIVDIKIEGVPFCAEDVEVVTKDLQRIGVRVCGTVHRPDLAKSTVLKQNWSQYKTFYTNDDDLVGRYENRGGQEVLIAKGLMQELSQQAMKVCVGDRIFNEAVVGTARDVLRTCMDEEISKLAEGYGGLEVRNVVVPDIILGDDVKQLMDDITKSRFETDLAVQNAIKAKEQANERLAQEQGSIRVEQGRVQEQKRQEAITADLEKQALEAQLAVIIAQKANDLRNAQEDQKIAEAQLEVEKTRAQAEIASVLALANLYADNPEYLDFLIQQLWAQAWANTDKVVVPAGTNPITILSPQSTPVPIVINPTTAP